MASHSMPSFFSILGLLTDESTCINYLVLNNVIRPSRICECGSEVTLNISRKSYRCGSRFCRKEISMFKGTFFFKSTMSVEKIMHLAYIWLCNISVSSATLYTGFSSQTICNYFSIFRNLVADSLELSDLKIGGEGVVVELDESKFGKRKFHRGHRVEGTWIFGGVERTEERKLFLVPVPDRSADTLVSIIAERVLPGSIIFTDMWRAYDCIEERLQMLHYTVNHSAEFVNSETGVHTNTIEGTWSGLKREVPSRNRIKETIDEHLFEYVWRRKFSDDLWSGFVEALAEIEFL